MARALWKGVVLAESDQTVVVDGDRYFPRLSLTPGHFESSKQRSECPDKGTARYLDIVVGDERNENAAWYYEEPTEAADAVRGRIAFGDTITVEG